MSSADRPVKRDRSRKIRCSFVTAWLRKIVLARGTRILHAMIGVLSDEVVSSRILSFVRISIHLITESYRGAHEPVALLWGGEEAGKTNRGVNGQFQFQKKRKPDPALLNGIDSFIKALDIVSSTQRSKALKKFEGIFTEFLIEKKLVKKTRRLASRANCTKTLRRVRNWKHSSSSSIIFLIEF